MKNRSSAKMMLALSLAAVLLAGCSALMPVNERALSVEDIINMAKAEVGTDVIKRQIEVTRSRFKLDAQQIVMLKKAGVDDKVLEAMIETEAYPEYFDYEFGYSPYEYGFHYYNNWYPVSTHYPYVYQSMYPYTSYRRSDLIGRFYRYAPVMYPPYANYRTGYNPRYEWRYPERREPEEEEK